MNYSKKILPYFAAPILALLTFFLYFNLWHADLTKPIFNNYEWDTLFHAFFTKTIVDNGWFMVNKFVGLPQFKGSFYLYDFPLEGSSFAFLILKFFSFFTSNSFLILNLYFLTTISLVALAAFAALRNFGISIFSSLLISILYDFLFYHIQRSIFHALLANYAAIPLIVMVGFWIISNKIQLIALNEKKQYSLRPNRFFFIAVLICAFVASSDVYYALYSCIFFMMAWLVRALQGGKFFDLNFITTLTISFVILITLAFLYMPSFIYWANDGMNPYATIRYHNESEYYALRIIDLLIPTNTHYIEYLANIRNFFNENIVIQPDAIFERSSMALGIVASLGFIFLLFWIVASSFVKSEILQKTINKLSLKANEIILISNLAALNLFSILFATVGGFVMLIIPVFSMLRAHGRFSIFIAFISMLMVAIIFDKILERNIFKKKFYSKIIVLTLAVLALFDQLGSPKAIKYHNPNLEAKFISDKSFVEKIEEKMPSDSRIFILPPVDFPEGGSYNALAGYLHSKNLFWSYPAMHGRASAIWQKEVVKLEFAEFVKAIKKQGFNGIFIHREGFVRQLAKNLAADSQIKTQYFNRCKVEKDLIGLKEFESKLDKISKQKLISQDADFSFYEL